MPRKPRHLQVQLDKTPYYHVMSRCIRKMMLTDDDERKDFMLAWLKQLHAVYAVQVCRYAMMGNHFHLVVRIDAEMANSWSPLEVATRWSRLHPPRDWRYRPMEGDKLAAWIANLARMPELIDELRLKLVNLGQFMKEFKQRVAQVFNRKDEANGAFWQGRYTCVPLAGEGRLLAGMVYVDLNPQAAGIGQKPEDCPHGSLHESVASREKERQLRLKAQLAATERVALDALSFAQRQQEIKRGDDLLRQPTLSEVVPNAERHAWMLPVGKNILKQFCLEEYLRLVDFVSRTLRQGKAQVGASVADILERTQAKTDGWVNDVLDWLEQGRPKWAMA